MDLQQLRERGGIVPSAPVKREVSWTHSGPEGQEVTDTFTVHVVKHSFGTIERLLGADPKDQERSQRALLISESIGLGDEGLDRLTYAEAYQLEPRLARALLDAINEVNGTGGVAAKN